MYIFIINNHFLCFLFCIFLEIFSLQSLSEDNSSEFEMEGDLYFIEISDSKETESESQSSSESNSSSEEIYFLFFSFLCFLCF